MRDNLLKEKHSGGLVGHFGHDKTYAQICSSYNWLGMRSNVKKFMDRCRVFQYAKWKKHKTGLYHPLPIPYRSWDEISMDFVLGLPRTHRGSDSIFSMVYIFSKMAHFISCHKTSVVTHIENLFLKEVVRLHGLTRSIVLDRDTKFVGHFWRNLWKRLGKVFYFISTYQPYIDGQTEVLDQSLVNILRRLVSEHHNSGIRFFPSKSFLLMILLTKALEKVHFK
jgi:hypothetical protein